MNLLQGLLKSPFGIGSVTPSTFYWPVQPCGQPSLREWGDRLLLIMEGATKYTTEGTAVGRSEE